MRRRFSVHFSRRAAGEIAAAEAWWAENRRAAPDAIADELAKVGSLLQTSPEIGAPTHSTRLTELRRIFLDRVGYHIYYRVDSRRARVTVVTFWHARRRPPPL